MAAYETSSRWYVECRDIDRATESWLLRKTCYHNTVHYCVTVNPASLIAIVCFNETYDVAWIDSHMAPSVSEPIMSDDQEARLLEHMRSLGVPVTTVQTDVDEVTIHLP